jgi:hypothetical protein
MHTFAKKIRLCFPHLLVRDLNALYPGYVSSNCQPGLVALARACGEACQLEDIRAKLAVIPLPYLFFFYHVCEAS